MSLKNTTLQYCACSTKEGFLQDFPVMMKRTLTRKSWRNVLFLVNRVKITLLMSSQESTFLKICMHVTGSNLLTYHIVLHCREVIINIILNIQKIVDVETFGNQSIQGIELSTSWLINNYERSQILKRTLKVF